MWLGLARSSRVLVGGGTGGAPGGLAHDLGRHEAGRPAERVARQVLLTRPGAAVRRLRRRLRCRLRRHLARRHITRFTVAPPSMCVPPGCWSKPLP